MIIEIAEREIQKLPFFGPYYLKNAAGLKRRLCLLLDGYGLLKPFSFVQWLATYKCNFFCPFCEASAGKPAENELTTKEALAMIDDLAHMGVKRLVVSGGEPLVRRDLIDVMRHADRRRVQLGLVTNGYLVEELWDELKKFKYFLFFTSLDGLPEYHDHVRMKHSFQRVLKGLSLFKTIAVRTRMVNTVLHRENIGQLEALFEILKHSGANRWHLVPLAKMGRASQVDDIGLDGQDLKYLGAFISKRNSRSMAIDFGESSSYIGCFDSRVVGRPFFCGAGLTRCAVMPDGEVLGCQTIYNNAYSEGNIRDKPFSRIWKEEFRRFRTFRNFDSTCKNCHYFRSCLGGCWSEMEKQKECLKSLWENDS